MNPPYNVGNVLIFQENIQATIKLKKMHLPMNPSSGSLERGNFPRASLVLRVHVSVARLRWAVGVFVGELWQSA